MQKKLAIIIIGPPGSGKGTQGKLLAKEFGFNYVEMGPMLARYAANHQKVKQKIRDLMKEGRLVPNEIVIKALIGKFSSEKGIILDGVPRKIGQAEGVHKLSKKYGLGLVVIYLELKDKEVIKRLTSRKICPTDGYSPPYPEVLKKTHCGKCGAKLKRRADDTEEVIKERLLEYHKKTEPIIKFLEGKRVKILYFDGKPPVFMIYKKVSQAIKKIINKNGKS